jgi:hypothetical protein
MTAVLILISTAITRRQFRGDTLPIPGNPPLTEDIVGKASHFFEWLLDAHLTLEQRAIARIPGAIVEAPSAGRH